MASNHGRASLRVLGSAALSLCCAAALALPGAASASPAPVNAPYDAPLDGYVTNGNVNAVVQSGGTTYIGGKFSEVGPRTGSLAGVSSTTATYDSALVPDVIGTVDTMVSDGNGGWYIGGDFSAVDGTPISNAAHITAQGTLDPDWNPAPEGQVTSIALSPDGSTVYLGGYLTEINSASGRVQRSYLAAVSASSGDATSWNPDPDSVVEAIATSGSTVYLGGDFGTIDGTSRPYIAALDATTGDLDTGWEPTLNNEVSAITVSSDGSTVYVGGDFSSADSTTRYAAAAFDGVPAADDAALASWDPITGSGSRVQALALSPDGSTVYLGGGYINGIAGATPGGLVYAGAVAAVGTEAPGMTTGWNPNPNGTVESIAVSPDGSTVYLGGVFTEVYSGASAEVVRNHAAAISSVAGPAYGYATSWDPEADNNVETIAATSSSVFMGGDFNSVNAQPRSNLAALNSTTGVVTSWNPGAGTPNSDEVSTLALSVDGSTLYVGGSFPEIAGVEQPDAGAFNTSTGALTAWDPGFYANGGGVSAIAAGPSEVYVAGSFTEVNYDRMGGGEMVPGTAAFNPATGLYDPTWIPDTHDSVTCLAVSPDGSTVYLGGDFTTIGSGNATEDYVAAVNAASGALDSAWSPDPSSVVNSIAVSASSDVVYLGGYFTSIGAGVTRDYAAAVGGVGSQSVGDILAWNPAPNAGITTVAVAPDGSVYLGGDFSTLATGSSTTGSFSYVAQTDPTSGYALSWDPAVTGPVNSVSVSADDVAVGGEFSSVGLQSQANIADFAFQPAAPTAAFTDKQSSTSLEEQFTDTSSAVAPATITSWSWNFGDGDTSSSEDPDHTYAAPGSYTVTLTVTDSNGKTASTQATVVVSALPVAPVITKLKESSSSWKDGGSGTTFSFSLSEAAAVTLTFTEDGHKSSGKCVPNTASHHSGTACAISEGSITATEKAGSNSIKFAGKISSSKKLGAGSYKVAFTATASKLTSKAQSLSFTIKPK